MSIKVINILAALDRIAPMHLAEKWDNVGLLIGDEERETNVLLLGLDPTLSLLDEAITLGANTIITHHPCIFHPLQSVRVATPTGAFLEKALVHKINVIGCHTNYDSAAAGVTDVLANLLGLEDLLPIHPLSPESNQGLGRIGMYKESLPCGKFMQRVFAALDSDTVQIAGELPQNIRSVALCGGSGSDLVSEAIYQEVDVYLSSEIKHSTARLAEESGLCVIDASHYATEKPAMKFLAESLETFAHESDWDIKIYQSRSEKPAFTFSHKNDYSIE